MVGECFFVCVLYGLGYVWHWEVYLIPSTTFVLLWIWLRVNLLHFNAAFNLFFFLLLLIGLVAPEDQIS